MRKMALRLNLGLLLSALLPGAAAAVEPLDRFNFSIGTYATRFDTKVRADGEAFDGTTVDLRRDLGLDPDHAIAFAGLSWRPFERHEFGLWYFSDGTEAERRLQRDISFEDHVYRASSTVRTEHDLDSIEAYYVWWGMRSENWALGPRLGLTWYRVELGLEATLDIDGEPVGRGVVADRFNGDLPAPTLGAGWRWTPGEDWRISADAGWLSTRINDIDGTVGYGRLGVEWHPWSNVGLLLDCNFMNIRASTERRHFNGHLEVFNSGVRLGLVYRR